jgi:hypothetical protein
MRDHDQTPNGPMSASSTPMARMLVGLVSVFALSTGCALHGIEPDEIDIADAETGALTGSAGEAGGDGDGDNADDSGEETSTTTGNPTTGDGDPDPSGDGDGDPAATPCAEYEPIPVVEGDNAIEVPDLGDNFVGSCGLPDGPDAIFSFEATVAGQVSFTLTPASFEGVIYLVGADCTPFVELACDGTTVQADVQAGETIHAIVDSNLVGVGGTATLTISLL